MGHDESTGMLIDQVEGKVIGPKRGARITKKWIPKEWRPEYEAITALSCTGLSNEALGKRFGYGKQQISNILNTPQAKKLREIIVERLRATNNNTLGERIDNLREVALKRVESVLTDDDIFSRSPLAIFDRSLGILKSTGNVKDNGIGEHPINNITNIKNAMIVSPASAHLINEGLAKSEEAKRLNAGQKDRDNGVVGTIKSA